MLIKKKSLLANPNNPTRLKKWLQNNLQAKCKLAE
jgi:hypothetical protein